MTEKNYGKFFGLETGIPSIARRSIGALTELTSPAMAKQGTIKDRFSLRIRQRRCCYALTGDSMISRSLMIYREERFLKLREILLSTDVVLPMERSYSQLRKFSHLLYAHLYALRSSPYKRSSVAGIQFDVVCQQSWD